MKKYWLLTLLIPLCSIYSCIKDESAYYPQEKEDVKVDMVENEKGENQDEDEVLPEGVLVPGIHLVKLNVEQPNGETVERRFKYFMPISIDESRPISLIFEFHGSYEFDANVTPDNPLDGLTTGYSWFQHAVQENCVICVPAGTAEYQADGSGAVNWQYSEKHLPFFDAMVEYFKSRTPSIDTNRIYATGQSSGAIFSFVLAFNRPEVVAAITPRAGQMNIDSETVLPTRAVPVRVFAGEDDDIVVHSAVLSNMTAWAERIGGYFASDMEYTEEAVEIENYTTVDTRIWSGGLADYQIYTLRDVGHGINQTNVMPYMWEFMESHPLNADVNNLFITCSTKEITAQCGQPINFEVNYPDGAEFTISDPKGWNLQQNGKNISLTGPKDFYGDVLREGVITMTVTADGNSVSRTIPLKLMLPKDYFELGDIYYDEDFNPAGVVFWVNQANIREAKVVGFEETSKYLGDFGTDFITPDMDDGKANTAAYVARNSELETPFTASNSAVIWASERAGGDWYLPAFNEIQELFNQSATVNSALASLGKSTLPTSGYYLTSTVVSVDGSKRYYELYVYNRTASLETRQYADKVRAIKQVKK